MKLITRRILFCSGIIIFLISAPIITLYTFGFRYDFNQKKIVQSGIIYLTPNIQDNIKILIDGKEEPDKLKIKGIFKKDFILYNLMPKTYNIKISKAGYHSWEKNLNVLPGFIAYAQPLLLPSNPKINLIFSDANVIFWSISADFKKIFYLKKDSEKISANIFDRSENTSATISILNLKDQRTNGKNQENIIAHGSKGFFAPDGKKFGMVLTQDTAKIILFDFSEKNISIFANFTLSDKIIDARWDDSSRYFFYLSEKGELGSYDTVIEKSNKIFDKILGFSLKNGDIYYLDQNNLFAYRSPINNPFEKQQLSYVPIDSAMEEQKTKTNEQINIDKNFQLLISAKNAVALITPDKNLFTISQNGIPINIGSGVEYAEFSKNGDNLLFNSSFEIFTNAPGSNLENLVTRLSQKISNVGWYGDYEHIWFFANQTIKNIELDSRPSPNIIDFLSIIKKNTNIIHTDSGTIYYDEQDGDIFSLYQVEPK